MKITKEQKKLLSIGKLVAQKIKEENFALNIPIVVEEEGYVIEIDKLGNKKKLSKIKKNIFANVD